jgi:hypothetical protein
MCIIQNSLLYAIKDIVILSKSNPWSLMQILSHSTHIYVPVGV